MKPFFLALAVVSLLSGCVSVNEKMVRKTGPIAPPSQPPVVELKMGEFIQKLNGEGDHRGVVSNQTVQRTVGDKILGRWQSKGLISGFGLPGQLTGDPRYTLTIGGERNEDMSWAGSVFTGLSLYLIPSSTTITYDLALVLTDNKTGKQYTSKIKNGATIYQQLFLIPAIPFSLAGMNGAIDDIADYAFVDFQKQGAFR